MNSLPHTEQIFMLLLVMFPLEMLTFSTNCSGASLSFLTQQFSRGFTTNTICAYHAIACIRVFNAGQFVTKCDCFALLDCSAVFTFPSKNSSCHLITFLFICTSRLNISENFCSFLFFLLKLILNDICLGLQGTLLVLIAF